MKSRFGTISIHLMAWILLLMVPFLSMYQVTSSIVGDFNRISLLPIIVLSLTLMAIFYLNYFFLMPKFLFKKRYKAYAIVLLFSFAFTIASSYVVFELFGIDPEADLMSLNPIFSKISPIAKANAFLMLIAAFVTSISLALNDQLKLAEKERLNAQIASLKSQMNPHFLFNTLNNIYATSLDKAPQTAKMIEMLSAMMRYTLKETQREYVSLSDELQYLNNFIELQRIRLEDRVYVSYTVRGQSENLGIAPMLLIPFIENAFKHGVNAEEESRIEITIVVKGSELGLQVVNNKVNIQHDITEPSGLGIVNTKHRLELTYPAKYTLKIKETGKIFSVSLQLNLQ